MGLRKEGRPLPPGQELVACFRPFIAYLAASGLAPKTILWPVDNLWRLGGPIIADRNEMLKLRKQPVCEEIHRLRKRTAHHGRIKRSFDATCLKLPRFLDQ